MATLIVDESWQDNERRELKTMEAFGNQWKLLWLVQSGVLTPPRLWAESGTWSLCNLHPSKDQKKKTEKLNSQKKIEQWYKQINANMRCRSHVSNPQAATAYAIIKDHKSANNSLISPTFQWQDNRYYQKIGAKLSSISALFETETDCAKIEMEMANACLPDFKDTCIYLVRHEIGVVETPTDKCIHLSEYQPPLGSLQWVSCSPHNAFNK